MTPQTNDAIAPVTVDQAVDLAFRYYSVFEPDADGSVLDGVLAPGWQNLSSGGAALDQASFLGLVAGLRQAVPDLRWQVDELLTAGDRIIVRGQGSGTLAAPFFGMQPTGKSFSILSIDIHQVRDGRIASSYHLEDWAGAMQQLHG